MKLRANIFSSLLIAILLCSSAAPVKAQLWQNLQTLAKQDEAKSDWSNAEEHYRQAWLLADHSHASESVLNELRASLERTYIAAGEQSKADELRKVKTEEVRGLLIGVTKRKIGGEEFDTPKIMVAAATLQNDKSIKVKTETVCCGTTTNRSEAVLKPGEADYDLVAGKLKNQTTDLEQQIEPFELKSLETPEEMGKMKCDMKK